MPEIREYKISPAAIGDEAGHDTVDAREFKRWLASEERILDCGDVYEWRPNFPAGYITYSTTISEEALMRSNWDAIVETFEDEIGIEDGEGEWSFNCSSGTLDLDKSDARIWNALALACKLDADAERYPVLDGERTSDEEYRLTEEAYSDYGRGELVDALETLSDIAPSLRDILDDNLGDIRDDLRDIAEPYLRRLADGAVNYGGEMYFGYRGDFRGERTDSWNTLEYALQEQFEDFRERPRPDLGELLARLVDAIRADKLRAERAEFEKHQKPLIGEE